MQQKLFFQTSRFFSNQRKRTGIRLSKSVAFLLLFLFVSLYTVLYLRLQYQQNEADRLRSQTRALSLQIERLHLANQDLEYKTALLRKKLEPLEALGVFALDPAPDDTEEVDRGARLRVVARSLIVREGPGKDFLPQDALQTGTRVTFQERRGVWYKVRYNMGEQGWVHSDYLVEASSG